MAEELPKSNSIKTLFSYNTKYNADSVEWCPHKNYRHVFVCANYELIKGNEGDQEKKRIGKILLFTIDPKEELKLEEEIETAAVLDQKWCLHRVGNNIILGVVNANSQVELYRLKENIRLEKISSYTFVTTDPELLILSLDWSNNKYNSTVPEIVCSDSKGNIHVLTLTNKNFSLKESIHSHDFETWIAAYYYWNENVLFSGGDDSLFCKYDLRIGSNPVVKNRTHEAGVTSIHSSCLRENVLATGSYDGNARLWDLRNLRFPTVTTKMPGPVWRLKWDPFSNKFLLAACMLGGMHILENSNESTLDIVESYYQHKNIVYGVDWSFLNDTDVKNYKFDGNLIIGSCSFYDNLLCVSKLICKNILDDIT